MSVRSLIAPTAAVLLGVVALATPAAAAEAASVPALTLTAARVWATAAALLGVAGAIVGGRALRVGNGGRRGAVVALVSGPVAVVGGVVVLAVADGGPGTGNGVVGVPLPWWRVLSPWSSAGCRRAAPAAPRRRGSSRSPGGYWTKQAGNVYIDRASLPPRGSTSTTIIRRTLWYPCLDGGRLLRAPSPSR
ncbi:hypothetical protein GCM10029964_106490 [Kibdelosporangium lantanae]